MAEKATYSVSAREIVQKKQIETLFQPIVAVEYGSIYGFEALARGPKFSQYYGAVDLFSNAANEGYLEAMNELTSQLAIVRFKQQSLDSKLFINFSPQSITHDPSGLVGLIRCMQHECLSPERVVIEITEHYPVENYRELRTAVDQCQNLGVKIAIDDLGAGHSGLRLWSEIQPDYVKLDHHFVQEIQQDDHKKVFIDCLQVLASRLGCKIIAEGIENDRDFAIVSELNVPYAQGFYIGRPGKRAQRAL